MSKPTSTTIGFAIPTDLLARLERIAERDGRNRSQMARFLLKEAVERREKQVRTSTDRA